MENRHLHYKIVELEEEIKILKTNLTFIKTQARNALTELDEGEIDLAMQTLNNII